MNRLRKNWLRTFAAAKEFLRSFQKDLVIGIDIGSSSIKVAQFAKKEEGLSLVKLAFKEITPQEDAEAKKREAVSVLKELLQEVDRKRAQFVVSFNSPRTGLRVVGLPPMPDRELREGVRLELRNYFSFPTEGLIFDVEQSGETSEKGIQRNRVLIAAAPRGEVMEIVGLLRKVGIHSARLVPAACGMQKWVEQLDWREDEIRCCVDIGARNTELAIFKGKELVFSRKLPVAGLDFSEALTGALASERGKVQLGLEEAERIKRAIGIPSEGKSEVIEEKLSTMQMLSLLRSPLEELTREIGRSFDYYQEETGGGDINLLLLLGRGAYLKGLPEALSQGLGIEVKVGNPLENLAIDWKGKTPEGGSAAFAAAIGAALSERKGVNLLPPEIREKTEQALKRASLESAVAVTVLALLFVYTGMRIQLSNYQKRIATAELERASLGLALEEARSEILAHQVLAQEPYWDEVFKELGNRVPREIHLTELGLREGKVTMKGLIVSGNVDALLSDFLLSLEAGLFKNVKLVTARERREESGRDFELECRIE